MDDEGLLEAARTIRPYLPELVGPAADRLDRQIAGLLTAASRGEDVTTALQALLDSNQTTSDFVAEVLADPPHYRPSDRRLEDLRTRDLKSLPGRVGPVQAGKYSCPHGDCVWYRRTVGDPVPSCPTHGADLIST